jgi:hypothetical protein
MPPSTFDHYRPAGATVDCPAGVYRVVGVDDESVTLLRVGDAEGRRVNTGETVAVDRQALAGFVTAENPDGRPSPGAAIAALGGAAYWSTRAFVGELLAHPLASAAAVAVVVAGAVGDGIVAAPTPVFGAALLVGSLGLAYVGSGRLSGTAR